MIKLYTIGYEGCDIDQILDVLSYEGVKLIADIRALPLSRKPGFSKRSFGESLNKKGIEYRHFRELGDPKTGREAAKRGDYNVFREIYLTHFSKAASKVEFQDLITEAEKQTTCLLCFEKNPNQCHRLIVAESMNLYGFKTINLSFDGTAFEDGKLTKRTRRNFSKSFATAEQNIR